MKGTCLGTCWRWDAAGECFVCWRCGEAFTVYYVLHLGELLRLATLGRWRLGLA